MILVDTSVIVAWLDRNHEAHQVCSQSLAFFAGEETLAVSSITYAELASGARTKEGVDEALREFERLDLTFEDAWRAGQAFRQYHSRADDKPVLPDFFIRAQAATRNLRHLTNDRRRIRSFPEVDFEFVGARK